MGITQQVCCNLKSGLAPCQHVPSTAWCASHCAHLLMPCVLLPPTAVVSDSRGRPHTIRRAVCMKEEDAGMAWKHYEYRNGACKELRRSNGIPPWGTSIQVQA